MHLTSSTALSLLARGCKLRRAAWPADKPAITQADKILLEDALAGDWVANGPAFGTYVEVIAEAFCRFTPSGGDVVASRGVEGVKVGMRGFVLSHAPDPYGDVAVAFESATTPTPYVSPECLRVIYTSTDAARAVDLVKSMRPPGVERDAPVPDIADALIPLVQQHAPWNGGATCDAHTAAQREVCEILTALRPSYMHANSTPLEIARELKRIA